MKMNYKSNRIYIAKYNTFFTFFIAKSSNNCSFKMCSFPSRLILFLCILISGALTASVGEYLFGGEKAENTGQFPYVVSLRRNKGAYHMCGASILSSRFIVTAGHCYSNFYELSDYSIVIGALLKRDRGLQEYTLKQFILHPNFTYNETIETLSNDIALIELNEEIQFNRNVSHIEISRDFIDENVAAIVSGWGGTQVCFEK